MKVLIEGMSCGHCVNLIKEALSKLSGVTSVEVKLDEKAVYIEGSPVEEEVKEAILVVGYDVINIE